MNAASKGRIALLYDCTYPHMPGGGQKRLYEVFRRLVAKGWQVDWYGMKTWDGDDDPVIEGIRYISVAPARQLYGPNGKRLILQTVRYGMAIARFPKIGRYDIVHMGQWPYFHFFPVWIFTRLGGARTSVDWWEVWGSSWRSYYGLKGYVGMALERVCSRLAGRLVAISETGRRELEDIGVNANRITVIHNGIDFSAIQSAPIGDQAADLVYLGRLQPHKNVDLLIEALALLKRRGQILTLAIIGDGPERLSLERLAVENGVSAQISWLGAIEDDADVYAALCASRVFVHPSTKEGGGSITSLEANAAGLPVVAFSVPGGISPELIIQNQNGMWVSKFDVTALAEVIADTIALNEGGGSNAQAISFAQNFDWDGITNQYDEMFDEQLSRARQSPA